MIVDFLQSHFHQVKISFINMYTLEDRNSITHFSFDLFAKKIVVFISSVMPNIQYKANGAIAVDISFFNSKVVVKLKI